MESIVRRILTRALLLAANHEESPGDDSTAMEEDSLEEELTASDFRWLAFSHGLPPTEVMDWVNEEAVAAIEEMEEISDLLDGNTEFGLLVTNTTLRLNRRLAEQRAWPRADGLMN